MWDTNETRPQEDQKCSLDQLSYPSVHQKLNLSFDHLVNKFYDHFINGLFDDTAMFITNRITLVEVSRRIAIDNVPHECQRICEYIVT